MKTLDCDCGFSATGETDDAAMQQLTNHKKSAHPEKSKDAAPAMAAGSNKSADGK